MKRYILTDYQIKNCKSQMVRLSCSTSFSHKSLSHLFAICASFVLNKFGLANLITLSLEDRNCDVAAIYEDDVGKYRKWQKYSEIL